MAGSIFYFLLNMSIFGSVAGLLVVALRRVRILPRLLVYLLWLMPLYQLLIPLGITSRYSLMNFIPRDKVKTIVVWERLPLSPEWATRNSIQAVENYAAFPMEMEYKTDLLRDIFSTAGMIWAIVAAAAVLCAAVLYIITKSALKDAEHIKENIYRSDKILSPAVYGIIKPKIILPVSVADNDLDYILRHERVHIRRRDNLWRVIAVITACVHWFNPLAWVFLKRFFADMELACDAGVLKKLDDNDKKAYASALLSCSAGKTYYASAFGGAKTRLRIKNILSYKKLTLVSGLCFAALFIMVAVTVITNAAGG